MRTPAPPRSGTFVRLVPEELRRALTRAEDTRAGLEAGMVWAETFMGELPPRVVAHVRTELARVGADVATVPAAYHRGELTPLAAGDRILACCDLRRFDSTDPDLALFVRALRRA